MDGKIRVFGGRTVDTIDNVGLHEIYDPQTDIWDVAAPMPIPRSAGAYGTYRGMLFYIGGECPTADTNFDQNEAYDLNTNSWRTFRQY